MQRIDGVAIATKVLEETKSRADALLGLGIRPGLAVVLVGDDPASRAYVRSKDKKAADLGFHSVKKELPASTTQAELLAVVQELNADPLVHGILVQSPPPSHINEAEIVRAIDPSKDLAAITREADIVIAAIGRPHFLGADHIREGAVVIDVGINRVDDPTSQKGYRLVGDVDYDAVAERCAAISPVPGGVGPMTIAMLLSNTVTAAERFLTI